MLLFSEEREHKLKNIRVFRRFLRILILQRKHFKKHWPVPDCVDHEINRKYGNVLSRSVSTVFRHYDQVIRPDVLDFGLDMTHELVEGRHKDLLAYAVVPEMPAKRLVLEKTERWETQDDELNPRMHGEHLTVIKQ